MSDEEEYDSERYDSDLENDGKGSEDNEGKRAYHNLLERKRRDNIKTSFKQLRDILPIFNKKKKERASKVQILKKSCDFIKQQKNLQEFYDEMASLEEEKRLLEKSIADLDKVVANNDKETLAKLTSMDLPLKRRRYLLEDEDTDSEDGDSSPPQPSPVTAASQLADLDKVVANNDKETLAKLTSMDLPLKRRRYLLEDEDTDSEDGDSSPPQPSPVTAASQRKKTKRI